MSVELHPAYVWDCNECGTENFERAIVPDMSPDDLEALRHDHGLQPWDLGNFQMMPDTVDCSECGASYRTVHFPDDDPSGGLRS